MSSTGLTSPRPRYWPQMRLAIALLKYGFWAVVSQSARTGRYGADVLTFGSSPPRNFGGTILADSGRPLRPPRGVSLSSTVGEAPGLAAACGRVVRTFRTKAAAPQYSVCFLP